MTTNAADRTGAVTEDNAATGGGSFTFGDVDGEDINSSLGISTAHAASTVGAINNHPVPADPTSFSGAITNGSTVKGTYGTFSFTRDDTAGTLSWTYTLDDTAGNANLNQLHAGQRAYEKLAIRVNDGNLDSSVEVITVTITGANDAPAITSVTDGAVADTANTAANTPTATGNFGVTDVDEGEQEGGPRPTYAILPAAGANQATVSGNASAYTITTGTGQSAVTWGTIALNTATGAWTFTANAASLNSLYNGEQKTLALTARVTDFAGATHTDDFTITLTGANDDPTITGVLADYGVTDTANMAANTPTVSGNFNTTDPDNGESEGPGVTTTRAPTYAITSGSGGNAATVTGTGGSYTITKGTGQSAVTWGTITLDTATGAWTFTANAAALTSLHDTETETLALTAQVTDASGGTDTEAFTITLTGANEDPVIDIGGGAQASVLIHGVRFTVIESGVAGNAYEIDIIAYTDTGVAINGNTISIRFVGSSSSADHLRPSA